MISDTTFLSILTYISNYLSDGEVHSTKLENYLRVSVKYEWQIQNHDRGVLPADYAIVHGSCVDD